MPGLRPPRLECEILCLEGSVISPVHEVLMTQFSLYVHRGGLKLHSFIHTVSHYRDPQLQVVENYSNIHNFNQYIYMLI